MSTQLPRINQVEEPGGLPGGFVAMIKEELGPHWAHICVDMQLLFAPGEDWGLAWLPKVVPRIASLCAVDPSRTVFTRFIPARRPGEGQGHCAAIIAAGQISPWRKVAGR